MEMRRKERSEKLKELDKENKNDLFNDEEEEE